MNRTRLNIFIEPDHAKQLEAEAAHRGLSKSAVIAAALSSSLSPDAANRREAGLAKRLDRLSRQFDRLERDQNILLETVALYVRVFLTVSIPVPQAQQEAARAQGRARYQQFIEQLGRHLQKGRCLRREIHEDIRADPPSPDADVDGESTPANSAQATVEGEGA